MCTGSERVPAIPVVTYSMVSGERGPGDLSSCPASGQRGVPLRALSAQASAQASCGKQFSTVYSTAGPDCWIRELVSNKGRVSHHGGAPGDRSEDYQGQERGAIPGVQLKGPLSRSSDLAEEVRQQVREQWAVSVISAMIAKTSRDTPQAVTPVSYTHLTLPTKRIV